MTDCTRRWQTAANLAARFHAGQVRKDGRTPYIAHPFRVAMIVREIFGFSDETILCAALLHDVIEDTPADYDDVAEACGTDVAEIVAAMTKDMRLPEAQREAEYDRGLAAGPWEARLIKLADVYDNFCDSHDDRTREKMRSRMERALAIAGSDPRLAEAVAAVRALL